MLRLRVPDGRVMRNVRVGGSTWSSFDATAAEITFAAGALIKPGFLERMHSIVAGFDS